MADEPRQEHELTMDEEGRLREHYTFRDLEDIRKIVKMNIGWVDTADVATWQDGGETYKLPVMLLGTVPRSDIDADPTYTVHILDPDDVLTMCIQGLGFFNGTEQVVETLEKIQREWREQSGG